MSSKDDYAMYLRSPAWRHLRKKAFKRDQHKCRACGDPAQQVHHICYPKILGQEKLSWLYAVCAPCHERIHEIAKMEGLGPATRKLIKKTRKQKRRDRQPKAAKSSFRRDEDWREYAAKLARESRERRRAA
jgi:5-methylcytosine-specific restriction endonuclease McrA